MALVEKALSHINSELKEGADSDLKKALCQAATSDSQAKCKVTVMHSSAMPGPPGSEDQAEAEPQKKGFTLLDMYTIGVAIWIAMSLIAAYGCYRYLRRKNRVVPGHGHESQTEVQAIDADQIFTKEAIVDAEKGKPDSDENNSLAGSTATPTSLMDDIDLQSVASDPPANAPQAVICVA